MYSSASNNVFVLRSSQKYFEPEIVLCESKFLAFVLSFKGICSLCSLKSGSRFVGISVLSFGDMLKSFYNVIQFLRFLSNAIATTKLAARVHVLNNDESVVNILQKR